MFNKVGMFDWSYLYIIVHYLYNYVFLSGYSSKGLWAWDLSVEKIERHIQAREGRVGCREGTAFS